MTTYQATIELPIGDSYPGQTAFLIEKIREVAWPRLLMTIEAKDRRELARMLGDLNVELQAYGLSTFEIEDVPRGHPGTLTDAFAREGL